MNTRVARYIVLLCVIGWLSRLVYHLILLRLDILDVGLTAIVGALALYSHRAGRLRSDVRTTLKILGYYLLFVLILVTFQFFYFRYFRTSP